MINVINTRSALPIRLFNMLRIAYIDFRLGGAETDLESYRGEVRMRIAQMRLHRRRCQELRVQRSLLERTL